MSLAICPPNFTSTSARAFALQPPTSTATTTSPRFVAIWLLVSADECALREEVVLQPLIQLHAREDDLALVIVAAMVGVDHLRRAPVVGVVDVIVEVLAGLEHLAARIHEVDLERLLRLL